jgi:hypothetical protein
MNILELKRKMLPMSGPQMDGGGGGGGQSSTGTQTQIQELPEWARGYAKNALEKGAALSEKPYQAYDQNRIAGFSPLQQQSQQGAANMQTNAGTSAGMNVAGLAALGGLNQDYQGGQFSGGRFGNRQAAQYMSPYIENAMQPQLREAQRSSDIMGQQNQAKAVGQGAFGGSRSGLVEAERQRNLGMQQGDIRAKGYQTAYEQAANQFNQDMSRGLTAQQLGEQSRQFGANLGLQGLNTALQGAGQLGTLGQQQFQQGMDINKLQNAYGGQQQALQQQGLSQAYQDFQNQQNYPYKQLGFMSDMIRGLPLGQVTSKSMYEPEPGMAQQIGSLGMGAYGLSKFMADGGMAYADGGSVDSPDNVERIVSKLSDQQLQQAAQAAQARGDQDQLEAIQSEMSMRASERNGLASAVTPQMADQLAGGGVVAFKVGGLNDYMKQLSDYAGEDISASPEDRLQGVRTALPGVKEMYGDSVTKPYLEEIKKERAGLDKMKDQGEGLAFLAASQALVRPGSKSRAVAGAMGAFGTEVMKMDKERREADRALRQSELTLATADQARADGQIGKAESLYDKSQTQKKEALDRKISVVEKQAQIAGGLEQARVQAAATMGKKTDLERLTEAQYNKMIESGEPANAATKAIASERAANLYGKMAGSTRADIAGATAREKAAEAVDMLKFQDPTWKEAKKNKDPDGMRAREQQLINERMNKAPEDKGGPAPAKQTPATKGPDLNTFMAAARKANPGVSDADLKAYYNSTYK